MTVAELDERMTVDEYARWMAFDSWRAMERQRAVDKAEMKRGRSKR